MPYADNDYQKFISWKALGHWKRPLGDFQEVTVQNPLCGDEVTLYYKIQNKDPKQIQFLGLAGDSCSICSAAAGLLFRRGSIEWSIAKELGANPKNAFTEDPEILYLEERELLDHLKEHPTRESCFLLPWKVFERICKEEPK